MSIQKADPREKKIALIFVLLIAGLAMVGGYVLQTWNEQIKAIAAAGGLDQARVQYAQMMRVIATVAIISLLAIAASLGFAAAKALRQKRYPALGVPSFKDVEVLEGEAAVKRAKIMLGVAGGFVIAALVMIWIGLL
jgi:hypothetical protein